MYGEKIGCNPSADDEGYRLDTTSIQAQEGRNGYVFFRPGKTRVVLWITINMEILTELKLETIQESRLLIPNCNMQIFERDFSVGGGICKLPESVILEFYPNIQ